MHPLQYGWVIYEQIQFYNESDKKKGYKNSFTYVCKFTNVEGFWLNWNKLENVTNMFYDGESRVIKRIDITCPTDQPKDISIEGQSIFKLGVEPLWEDPINENGGELRVTLNVTTHKTLAKFWESIVVLMIGGSLIDCEEICGARILDKSKPKRKIIEYRLEIWFKDWSNEKFKEALKSRVLDICKEYDYKPDISFVRHEKAKYVWIVCFTY
ncbi:uncharacterized protein [Blastocystis hominis]|uniref:Eukaryotic translation initiation factor 4E n=1 Tax=Blastocystis hominis TaxID=12968 RepID=D8M0N8_BLAHO|nr:uncharacterized protein [Blastocystis hominis]CBK21627.2 unnamed protein product [Blastocystis hominis]|eukprot:XP_012895675.1 uncharacterized protein [Blastocystis hominis]